MRDAVNIPIKFSKRVYNAEKKKKVCHALRSGLQAFARLLELTFQSLSAG